MTKAALVCFFRYTPRTSDHYKTQGDLFIKYSSKWYQHIDHLYIVDAGWNFNPLDLHPNTTVIRDDFQSHWWYMNKLISMVKEDAFMLIDPDTLIYNSDIVKQGFDSLQAFDVTAILDNSGTKVFFPANERRADRKRLTPYMTFMNTKVLMGIDVDFTPTQRDGQFEFDSMGLLTKQLVEKGMRLQELKDDRNSIYLGEDMEISTNSNMDGASYEWSVPLSGVRPTGYYHVRNSSIGLSLLDEYQSDRPAYDRRKSITPFREMMRLLMWQWVFDYKSGKLDQYRNMFLPVLEDYQVSMETWELYFREFIKYHSWLGE